MKKKLYLAVALIIALAATGLTYAQVTATTATSVGTVGPGGTFAEVRTAVQAGADNIALKWAAEDSTTNNPTAYYTTPAWSPSVDATGQIPTSVTPTAGGEYTGPGDVYYIDAAGYTGDIMITLYLNNPQDLSKNYTYLNMLVNVYSRSSAVVEDENVGTGTGGTTVFTDTLSNLPIVSGSVTVTDGTETFTISSTSGGVDTLTGSLGGTGTLDFSTGALSVTFNTAPNDAQAITADYTYSTAVTGEGDSLPLSLKKTDTLAS